MRSEIMFPTQCALIPETEMTYLSGGAEIIEPAPGSSDDDATILLVGLAGIAVVGVSTFIAVQISQANEARVRSEYEKTYGISAYNPDGTLTTDFQNYQSRRLAQGRDDLSTIAMWGSLVFFTPLLITIGLLSSST